MSLEKKIIDYISNKEAIDHWTNLKGYYRYETIISFMDENNLPLTWQNVTNYVKYDKRILYNCFKYVVVLEEFFKSMISKHLGTSEENLFKMEFSIAVNEFLKIKKPINYDDMDIECLINNQGPFKGLRNSIAHNKILLGRRFRSTSEEKKGIKGKTLDETLEIYRRVLPKSYRDGFVSDIQKCSDKLDIDSRFCFFKEDVNNDSDNPRIERMHQLEEIINYHFKNIKNLDKAMDSSILENGEYCNGTWGTIGDGLLHGLLSVRLLNEGIDTKGCITKIRTDLENNETQFELIKGKDILKFGHNKKYFNDDTNIPDNEKPVSSSHNDYLEAIIAAIYYDGGYYSLKKWFDDYLYDWLNHYKVEKRNEE